jgi:hypothetical protein
MLHQLITDLLHRFYASADADADFMQMLLC